jgi:hypothetical protein
MQLINTIIALNQRVAELQRELDALKVDAKPAPLELVSE